MFLRKTLPLSSSSLPMLKNFFAKRKVHNVTKFKRTFAVSTKNNKEGRTDKELVSYTFSELIDQQCQTYPEKDCFRAVNENIKWNYIELQKYSNALAAGLVLEGGRKGTSLAMALPLRVELIVGQISAAKSGGTHPFAALPAKIPPRKIFTNYLKSVNPGSLVITPKVGSKVQIEEFLEALPAVKRTNYYERINHPDFPYLKNILHIGKEKLPGMIGLRAILVYNPNPNPLLGIPSDPHKTCSLVLDSEEVTELSEYSIINTGYLVGHHLGLSQNDIICFTIPPQHSAGQSLGIGLTLPFKAKMVIPSDFFDPEITLKTISEERCTVLQGLPSYFASMIKSENFEKYDFRHLQKAIVAVTPGESMPEPALIDEIKSRFGLDTVLVTWGPKNSAGVVLIEKDYTKTGTFSTILDHTLLRIVSSGTDNTTSPGEKGSIQISGFHTDNSTSVKEKIWKDTGFTGTLDATGKVNLASI
eukprot:TRINITY_DN9705_c0_g1_i1.p1 TRINITY_DN9705_c0_g1~~TRINITY_DN9705_c0_g1_i1.p1  ORF type:complete len:474 (-),score=97.26 TRINITY_DN9705_c0_g1_i1:121-1542(-)